MAGIYSHLSVAELTAKRSRLIDSLEARLTQPTAAGGNGRSVQFQQSPDAIRAEIQVITDEITRKGGASVRGPIYIV